MKSESIPADLIEQRLIRAGCAYDFRWRAWQCPICRQRSALRLLRQLDGSVRPNCATGCAIGDVLEALGATFFDIAPAHLGSQR